MGIRVPKKLICSPKIGCGALSIGRTDNMYQLWGILTLAGLGIGGIVVPASIITTIICPDVSCFCCKGGSLTI